MSKNIFIGNGSGIAKRVSKIYVGDANGIARQVKKAFIGDANGIARQFYAAEKKHWWKRYNVTTWTSQQMRGVPTGFDEEEPGNEIINSTGHYCFGSYTFNQSTGLYTLRDRRDITFVPGDEDPEHGIYNYDLASNCDNTYVVSYVWCDNTTSGTSIYKITNGAGVYLNNGNGFWTETYYIHIDTGYYRKPSAHAASYTLVEGYNASRPVGRYYFNLENGYGRTNVDTNSNNETVSVTYDGYYWEYEGYHE